MISYISLTNIFFASFYLIKKTIICWVLNSILLSLFFNLIMYNKIGIEFCIFN